MNLSFSTPTSKHILSPLTKSWIACFIASSLAIVGILGLIAFQADSFVQQSNFTEQETLKQRQIEEQLTQQLNHLQAQVKEIQEIKKENTTLISALENLFDLVPDQITINTISLDQDSLTIKGITPSKELYIFLLESPLKAIFAQSKVDFFVLPSGWYNFVSVNKITPISKGIK